MSEWEGTNPNPIRPSPLPFLPNLLIARSLPFLKLQSKQKIFNFQTKLHPSHAPRTCPLPLHIAPPPAPPTQTKRCRHGDSSRFPLNASPFTSFSFFRKLWGKRIFNWWLKKICNRIRWWTRHSTLAALDKTSRPPHRGPRFSFSRYYLSSHDKIPAAARPCRTKPPTPPCGFGAKIKIQAQEKVTIFLCRSDRIISPCTGRGRHQSLWLHFFNDEQ